MSQRKSVYGGLAVCVIALAVFLAILYTRPEKPEGAGDAFSRYEKYLSYTKGDDDDLYVYLDKVDFRQGYDWYYTLNNHSNRFWCGTLRFLDEQGKTIYEEQIVNLKPGEVRMVLIQLNEKPADYRLSGSKWYAFSYPAPQIQAYESSDADRKTQTAWRNLVFPGSSLTEDACLAYAKYYYVMDELGGKESPAVYCYREEGLSYTEKNGVSFPDPQKAVWALAFDHDNQLIRLIDCADGKTLREISMEQ